MTDSGGNIFSRIPSYSVILIMIVMVVIGAVAQYPIYAFLEAE